MAGVVRSLTAHRGGGAPLVALAWIALALGVLVYLVDRPAGSAALLPWAGLRSGSPLFGVTGGWLPSCTHVFAFALLTAATAHPAPGRPYWACLLWWSIDSIFEAFQAPAWKPLVVDTAQRWLGDSSLLARYVAHGTFDPADLVAVTVGALAAAAVLRKLWHSGDRHDT